MIYVNEQVSQPENIKKSLYTSFFGNLIVKILLTGLFCFFSEAAFSCSLELGNGLIAVDSLETSLVQQNNNRQDMDILAGMIEDYKIKTVADLLERMVALKELPNHYLAVYQSRSREPASMEKPRILLQWRESVITFHGTEDHKGFNNSLEILTFNTIEKEFELYLLNLSEAKAEKKFDKNPTTCMTCHQNRSHKKSVVPRWDSYFLWPGFFGAHDGKLEGLEIEAYKSFQQTASKHPLYKHLPVQKDLVSSDKPGHGHRYVLADFGGKLFEQQQQVVVKDILTDSGLKPFKYAVLGAVACTSDQFPIESFIPEQVRQSQDPKLRFAQKGHRFSEILEDTVKRNDRSFADRMRRIKKSTGVEKLKRGNLFLDENRGDLLNSFYQSPEQSALTARVRYVVEGTNFQMSDWSMASPGNPDYTFAHGRFNFDDLKSWRGLLNEVSDQQLLKDLDDEVKTIRLIAEKLKDKEAQRLKSRYENTVAVKRIVEVNGKSDLQAIFDYSNPDELSDKEFAGYQLSDQRVNFCESLRNASIKELNKLPVATDYRQLAKKIVTKVTGFTYRNSSYIALGLGFLVLGHQYLY